MLLHRTLVSLCLTLLLAAAGWSTHAHAAESSQVVTTFEVKEIAGADRLAWPVRGGLPLAQGLVRDAAQLRLRDDNQQHVPMAAMLIARWPDGSIKWLMIETLADVNAGKSRPFTLELIAPANAGDKNNATSSRMIASQTADQITLENETIRLTFTTKPTADTLWTMQLRQPEGQWKNIAQQADSALVLQSQSPGEPDPEGNWLRDAGDAGDAGDESGDANDASKHRFTAVGDLQRTIRLEENSPQHATVRIDGHHVGGDGRQVYPYTLRITLRRGSSRVQCAMTFTVTEDVHTNFMRSLVVTMPGVDRPQRVVVGLPESKEASLTFSDEKRGLSIRNVGSPRVYDRVSFREPKPVHATSATLDANGRWRDVDQGEAAPGWLVVMNENVSATVGFRDFIHMHPKELAAEADGKLQVHLWPARGGKVLDLRRRYKEQRPALRENGADPHGGRGIAVTHEWWAAYEARDANNSGHAFLKRAADLARGASQPLRPIAPPAYIAATGAFGEFLPAGLPEFEKTDRALAFAVRYLHALRKAYKLDGMIDWGDLPIAGVGAVNHLGEREDEGIPFRGYNGWLNNDWGLAHGLFLHALRTGDAQALLDAENMTRHAMDVDTVHYYPEHPAYVGMGRRHDHQHFGNGPRDYCFAPFATHDHYLITGEGRAYDVAKLYADHPTTYSRYSSIRFWEISGEKKYLDQAMATLEADLQGHASGWPFLYGQNFRTNSYDGIGYTFFDSIHPDARLTQAAVKSLALKADAWTTAWLDPGHPTHLLAAMAHKANPSAQNTQALKAMFWYVGHEKIDKHTNAMNLSPDAPFEQYVQVNRQTMDIGRTDVLGLYYLIGLPRVMARLYAVGVDEDACLNYTWQWRDAPSFTETFDNSKIRLNGQGVPGFEHEYDYYTQHASPGYRPDARFSQEIVNQWHAAVGRTRLYEDGRLIGPSTFPRAQMRAHGHFGWTRRLSGALAFTTPDNADPRTNGRTYTLRYTAAEDEHWQDTPSFTEVMANERILPFGATGRVWAYHLQRPIPQQVSVYPRRAEDDAKFNQSLTRHALFIDGQSQGPIHPDENWGQFWKARAEKTWGRCESLILMILPEGVDPRTDGRTYKFTYTSEHDAAASKD